MSKQRGESDTGDPGEAGARLDERKRFVRLEPADEALLAGLSDLLARESGPVVDAFYEHLLRFEPLRAKLGDEATVERLKGFQRDYLQGLASGRYDEAYAADRVRIGRRHERIGLAPQWYLGSYGLYVDLLLPRIHEALAGDPQRAVRTGSALIKLLLLDAQMVLDAYYEMREKRAVERSEQLAAVGELAASIAHEVRNPLAGMKGAMEVLRKELSARAESREVADEMLAQLARLEDLVRDLLTFARPDSPRPRPFDLHEVLDRALRYHREAAQASGIDLQRRYGPGTSRLDADPQQVEQVVLNLIHNAVQAMEAGGGTLTLSTAAAGAVLRIVVADTGPGVRPDARPHVFQPFFTTKHRGSGLGLPIVRKIVEAHGGTIELASEPGRGTTVEVVLPAAAAEES